MNAFANTVGLGRIRPRGLSLLGIFLVCAPLIGQETDTRQSLRLGVVLDHQEPALLELWQAAQQEIEALLSTNHRLQTPKIISGDWQYDKVLKGYRQLVADPEIDAILSFGVVSGSMLAARPHFPKPVIALGLLDIMIDQRVPNRGLSSGITNLTFIEQDAPLATDLAAFYELLPYRKVAILFGKELLDSLSPATKTALINHLTSKKFLPENTEGVVFAVDEQPAASIASMGPDIDAAYLGYFPLYDKDQKKVMITALNQRQIPSFSSEFEMVPLGAMATIASATDVNKLARRMALNLEAILDGKQASSLPVKLDFDQRLTLNFGTMEAIGYSPPWDILGRAELVNEEPDASARIIDLRDILEEASSANLNLKIQQHQVEASRQDSAIARSRYRPSVDLDASGVQIDRDRARSSQGSQAERSFSGGLKVTQLLFSERVGAGIEIQDQVLDSERQNQEQTLLDVQFETAQAYLDILRADASVRIRKTDLIETRRNLEIAKLRQTVGYSGRSDVLRWESQTVTANQALIDARVQSFIAMARLNQLLHRDQDEVFRSKSKDAAEHWLSQQYQQAFFAYLKTPNDLNLLLNFLVIEANHYWPELKAIDASIAAQKRQNLSDRRAYFTPTVALQGDAGYLFSRDGLGSDSALPAAPESFSWSLGLNVSLPVFQGGRLRYETARSNVLIRQLEDRKRLLVDSLTFRVRAELARLVSSIFNLDSSKRASELAGQTLDLVQDGYARGTLAIAELLDAQSAALASNESAAIARFAFLEDILALERSVGRYTLMLTPQEWFDSLDRFAAYVQKEKSSSPSRKRN